MILVGVDLTTNSLILVASFGGRNNLKFMNTLKSVPPRKSPIPYPHVVPTCMDLHHLQLDALLGIGDLARVGPPPPGKHFGPL
jgi:hypothetical protein